MKKPEITKMLEELLGSTPGGDADIRSARTMALIDNAVMLTNNSTVDAIDLLARAQYLLLATTLKNGFDADEIRRICTKASSLYLETAIQTAKDNPSEISMDKETDTERVLDIIKKHGLSKPNKDSPWSQGGVSKDLLT